MSRLSTGLSDHERDRISGSPAVLEGWVTRDDLAKELNVSTRTLTRWTFMVGGIPHLPLGNRTLYKRDSVMEWLAAREQRPRKRKSR